MLINGVIFNVDLIDILNELKSQLNISGISLFNKMKDTNGDIMVQCPYHSNGQEKKPSAGIKKDTGQFHCFACNESYTLPEVISYCFGWNDVLGIKGFEWLLKNFATIAVERRKDIKLDLDRHYKDKTVKYITEQELDSYRYYHPYMYQRKLTNDVIELFDIGYDKDTECLTFPQHDIHGNVLFIARRSVNTKYFNYPEKVDKPLYGIYQLNKEYQMHRNTTLDEVIICESMLDCLSCWVWGKKAIALNGLGSENQFKLLNSLQCRKLILATDNDKRGLEARKRIRKNIKNKLVTEYIFPDNRKDINEMTKEEFLNLKEVFV